MIERVCPRCDAGNPSQAAFCGACGTSLEQLPARQAPSSLLRHRPQLPAAWKQSSRVVALGVATLVAEAGMAWLQQRRQAPHASHTSQAPHTTALASRRARPLAVGRRIVETWHDGQLQQRVVEQIVWLAQDDPDTAR